MAGRRSGAARRVGRLTFRSVAFGLAVLALVLSGCAKSQPSLDGGVPLGERDELEPGRYAVEEEITYEVELSCRVSLPLNSEALELGGVGTGWTELEPAPSPLYTLGVETEVRTSSIRSEDHTTWLELATLEPVPALGDYERTRDAGRDQAFEALRRVRGPDATEMDLVQAKVREFYLDATVAFRIPEGVKTELLDLELQVGGVLVAFFISPELPGEGVNLTLAAPITEPHYVIEASVDGACPRLVFGNFP